MYFNQFAFVRNAIAQKKSKNMIMTLIGLKMSIGIATTDHSSIWYDQWLHDEVLLSK